MYHCSPPRALLKVTPPAEGTGLTALQVQTLKGAVSYGNLDVNPGQQMVFHYHSEI